MAGLVQKLYNILWLYKRRHLKQYQMLLSLTVTSLHVCSLIWVGTQDCITLGAVLLSLCESVCLLE